MLIGCVDLEARSYQFAEPAEVAGLRYGRNENTKAIQDFGPTVLVEYEKEAT